MAENDNNEEIHLNGKQVSDTLHVVLNQLQDVTRQISGAVVLLDSLYIDTMAYRYRLKIKDAGEQAE